MQELLGELFRLYQKDVYLYLYSLSRDAELSEDLTSEVFLEVVKSFHRFRGDSDVKTWLFSIARHKWFGYLRSRKRQHTTVSLDDFLASGALSPEARCCNEAEAQRIRALIAMEPERTRTIVQMRLEGYSYHEISLRCGVSESSARVIDFRARSKIRTILNKEGFTDE